MRYRPGFTIVELLIVIVVIAILAAVSIVAYNGIQQRSRNAANIAAASQTIKLIKAYMAAYDTYPATVQRCATLDNLCTGNNGTPSTTDNTSFMTELKKVGTPSSSMAYSINGNYGMQYIYESTATFNGTSAPIRLEYWLIGDNQNCGVPNVSTNNQLAGISSTSGYTITGSGRTTCWVRLGLGA